MNLPLTSKCAARAPTTGPGHTRLSRWLPRWPGAAKTPGWRAKRRSFRLLPACLFVAALGFHVSDAQTQADLEFEACKQWAKLLPLIAEETTWPRDAPAQTNSEFVFGVFGPDKLIGAFNEVKAGPIKGRSVIIKTCHDQSEVQRCHLVFFSITEQDKFSKIVDKLKGAAVLTVGDWAAFCEEGGMLMLGVKDNRKTKGKTNPKLNYPAVKVAGLTMSGDLVNTLQENR